jgi:small subunit ribosomal protein S18
LTNETERTEAAQAEASGEAVAEAPPAPSDAPAPAEASGEAVAEAPPEPAEAAPRAEAAPGGVVAAARPAAGERREREPDQERPERRRRQFGRRRVCSFCVEKARAIDYKDPAKLRRYLSDRARIDPRRKTGTCAKHQRWLAIALKRARHLALLPYTPEHIRATGVFAGRGR